MRIFTVYITMCNMAVLFAFHSPKLVKFSQCIHCNRGGTVNIHCILHRGKYLDAMNRKMYLKLQITSAMYVW